MWFYLDIMFLIDVWNVDVFVSCKISISCLLEDFLIDSMSFCIYIFKEVMYSFFVVKDWLYGCDNI